MINPRFRKVDAIAIVFVAALWSISLIFADLQSFVSAYAFKILIMSFIVCFTYLLIRRRGAVLAVIILVSIFSEPTGMAGYNGIIIVFIAGVNFEIMIALLQKKLKNPVEVILSTCVSVCLIPFMFYYFFQSIQLENILNFALATLFISLIGALLSNLLWYKIKSMKAIIKYEYAL